MKDLRGLNYEERFKALKLQPLEKKKEENGFGPDSQDPIQPIKKARTKKVIT